MTAGGAPSFLLVMSYLSFGVSADVDQRIDEQQACTMHSVQMTLAAHEPSASHHTAPVRAADFHRRGVPRSPRPRTRLLPSYSDMRYIVLRQYKAELERGDEDFLFESLGRLEHRCDSLTSCHVQLEGHSLPGGDQKSFTVTLMFDAGEHRIHIASADANGGMAPTPTAALRAALVRAEQELRILMHEGKCRTCCRVPNTATAETGAWRVQIAAAV